MQRTAWIVVTVFAFAGCQQSAKPTATNSDQKKSKSEVEQAVATDEGSDSAVKKADFTTSDSESISDSPGNLVKKFVSALRAGEARTVSNLLTEKARYETRRHGLEVRPQMFPNTSFEIGETEFTTARKDTAYVKCSWFEPSSDAKTFDIVWIAKRQEEGWRISGFATAVVAGEQLKLLNFENVEEMLSVMESASGEAAATKTSNVGKEGT